MEITRQPAGDGVVLKLHGRLDANWCGPVEAALSAAVHRGEHRLSLDMAGVSYLSSAGIRVLLACYKQLRAIDGRFGVVCPSEAVRSVLELAGLKMLIAADAVAAVPAATADPPGTEHRSARADYRVFPLGSGAMRVEAIGDPSFLQNGLATPLDGVHRFDSAVVAVGIGALGRSGAENGPRFGEFLAAAGVAVFQPGDGSSRPDFMVSEGALVPEGQLVLGLCGRGAFASLLRFEANAKARTVGLAELAAQSLECSGASAAAVVAITETAGLVGATLRKSPAAPAGPSEKRFGFPQIRDWLSFTGERAFRDSTSLLAGIIARPGASFGRLLRPLGRDAGLLGHWHAAAFSYRPLRKGRIELQPAVRELFDGHSPQAVLHLLSDSRGIHGAGESEFLRGAVWISPIET